MDLALSADERAVLRDVLEQALGNVREEIYKTDTSSYREQLHAREEIIRGVLDKVGAYGAV